MTGWIITKDYEDNGRVGFGMTTSDAATTLDSFNNVVGRTITVSAGLERSSIPTDKSIKWRSFTDDGDPCYDGIIHFDWLLGEVEGFDDDDDLGYELDRFVMTDVGAVVVVYNVADIVRCDSTKKEWVERHPRIESRVFLHCAGIDPTAWIGVYG